MKIKGILFCTALVSIIATSCQKNSAPYDGPNKYHDLPKITQERAMELVDQFTNQLEDKLLMATLNYSGYDKEGETTTESYFSGDFSGHLNTSENYHGFVFEYVEGSYTHYEHDPNISEGQVRNYESNIGDGFAMFIATFPSRIAPKYNYTYYYDNTYLYYFGEGRFEKEEYDDTDFYRGVKIDNNGIVNEFFQIRASRDGTNSFQEEYSVSYYEEE